MSNPALLRNGRDCLVLRYAKRQCPAASPGQRENLRRGAPGGAVGRFFRITASEFDMPRVIQQMPFTWNPVHEKPLLAFVVLQKPIWVWPADRDGCTVARCSRRSSPARRARRRRRRSPFRRKYCIQQRLGRARTPPLVHRGRLHWNAGRRRSRCSTSAHEANTRGGGAR
jgi:hypothetical protein